MGKIKVVQINKTCGIGSTGKICVAISKKLNEIDCDNIVLYSTGGTDWVYSKKFCNIFEQKVSAFFKRIIGNDGFNSICSTKRLIGILDQIKPEIVHVHNIHSNDVNFGMLFSYLKSSRIKIVYTFHDCWAFTGYCPHFTAVKCKKWKSNCNNCPVWRQYSWFFDKSASLYQKKKEIVKGLDLTIVTPSQWLADLVKESFLKDYPVRLIHNGIDLNAFKPHESAFRRQNNIPDSEYMVLGVAFGWGNRKGLDVFIELSKRLPKKYHIVLVGTDENIDKTLPEGIISVHRTQSQQELAEIYSVADLFVNPTREENYPTVNMESLACGTPVLTFDTGGSPEIIDVTCGSVVPCDDIDSLEKEIARICETRPYSKESCLKHAEQFDMNDRFSEYIDLYRDLAKN